MFTNNVYLNYTFYSITILFSAQFNYTTLLLLLHATFGVLALNNTVEVIMHLGEEVDISTKP